MRHATLLLLFAYAACGDEYDQPACQLPSDFGRCIDEDCSPGSGGGGGVRAPRLSFSVPPRGASEGVAITPTIQVRLLDALGNLASIATDSVTIGIYIHAFDYNAVGTVEAYDAVRNTWATKTPMPTSRGELSVGVVSGVIYAIGGQGSPYQSLAIVEAYDPVTNSWTTKAPMPTPRYGLAVGVVTGILYAFGGFDQSGGALTTVEAYDPVANNWMTREPMPSPRYGFAWE